jgi:hypothetical protein
MKYKISWVEKKTGKSGKEYMVMHLRDENDVETQNVSTFELSYAPGQEIEGEIVQNGNFKNWRGKLEAPNFIKNSAYKTQQMEKVMDKKNESIGKFQDNKEWSIKTASTMNKAIDLAIAEKLTDPIELKDSILRWREWIWTNWEVGEDQYPPFI